MKKFLKNLMFVFIGVGLTAPAIAVPLLLSNKSDDSGNNQTIIMPKSLYINAKGHSKLASEITRDNAREFIAGIPLDDSQNSVTIERVQLQPNSPDGGSVLVTLKITRKNNPDNFKQQTYVVDGFKYNSENIFEQTTLDTSYLASEILPSDIAHPLFPVKELQKYITNIPDLSSYGADVSIQYKQADDLKGSLTLSLLYKKDTRISSIKRTVIGFKSLGILYREQIEKQFLNLNFTKTPNADRILPSTINNFELLSNYVLGFDIVLENDIKMNVSNINSNNEEGKISFDVTLSKGEGFNEVYLTKTFEVQGFKTTDMQDVDDVNEVFQSLVSYKAAITNQSQFVYPSVVNEDNIQMYILNLPNTPTNGVTLKYQNFVADDTIGSLGFDIKIAKGKTEKIISQSSIFGFFSDSIISFIMRDIQANLTKKDSNDFVHKTDPKWVTTQNFNNYFNYNLQNKYGVDIEIKKVDFINVTNIGAFRIALQFKNSTGLNKNLEFNYSLNSLFLKDVYPNLDISKSNRNLNPLWKSVNFFNAIIKDNPPKHTKIINRNEIEIGIVSTPGTGNVDLHFSMINPMTNASKFHELLRQDSNIVNLADLSSQLTNFNFSPPINEMSINGSRIYAKNGTQNISSLNVSSDWISWTVDNVVSGAENSWWLYMSFDTNGKYNFHHNGIKILVNYWHDVINN